MYVVDIDVGGTLTDGLFSDGERVVPVKVDTTPHDLTVCFMECLKRGAEKLGFPDLAAFTPQIDTLKWSSTVTSNVLAQRTGPKIGLIVTKSDNKKNLYGAGISPAIGRLIEEVNVVGLDEGDILSLVRRLMEQGVRRICISLEGAFVNPAEETDIRSRIIEEYPDHYLGMVPTVAGSEICKHPDDMTRTHYSLINAYIIGPLSVSLFKAEDELRDKYEFDRVMLIGHINGGVSSIAKTKAIDTVDSGPAFGAHAAAYFAKIYGIDRVISLDIGGTTAKVSVILNGVPARTGEASLYDIPLKMPAMILDSIALGGGTIVTVDPNSKELKIGPASMGSYPGPACYNLGGEEATVTDAFVELGLLNPDYFLGGSRRLDREKATEAIRSKVSEPLKLDVKESASLIVDRACNLVAEMIEKVLKKVDGGDIGKYTLFAFGGNGPLLACNIAEKLGIKKVLVFELGSVLSALGSAVSDISHVYEYFPSHPLSPDILPELAKIVEDIRQEALRDLEGEGLDPKKASYVLQLGVTDKSGNYATVERSFSSLSLTDKELQELLDDSYELLGTKRGKGEVMLEAVRGQSIYESPKCKLATYPPGGSNPDRALKDQRDVIITKGVKESAKCFSQEKIETNNTIKGPAIIEAETTTYVVPKGWTMSVDQYHNATVSK